MDYRMNTHLLRVSKEDSRWKEEGAYEVVVQPDLHRSIKEGCVLVTFL